MAKGGEIGGGIKACNGVISGKAASAMWRNGSKSAKGNGGMKSVINGARRGSIMRRKRRKIAGSNKRRRKPAAASAAVMKSGEANINNA